MMMFREALEANNLFDMGCVRNSFTWSIGHDDHTFTKERIDRYVANKEWSERFQTTVVEGLVVRSYDHKPILMTTKKESKGKRKRKFVSSWSKEKECELMAKEVWARKQLTHEPLKEIQNLLSRCVEN
ncbi:uncharacterized protein LOC121241185 [Juglans microcarpa x Juglans regia]|uniref:uncharacterized protein LOC121241185 n=1 Tax=Juglans microcarpa x Juglans regia TaxID=2249226 RepID=UPI001B7F2159|nr:uncharacterized protein LOC121241185 [Juglans microcarpa x Juglans regia]